MQTNQQRAQEIADALHAAHNAHKTCPHLKHLHETLLKHVEAVGPALGINPVPLSAGGQK